MKKAKQILILTILMLITFSMNTFLYAANFDTQNFNGGTITTDGGAASNSWGIYKNTGTRFVLELDDEEVGGSSSHRYYVNYIQNKSKTGSSIAMGTMHYGGYLSWDSWWYGATINQYGFQTAYKITDFSTGAKSYVSSKPSDVGEWHNDWSASGSAPTLSVNQDGIDFIASLIAGRAKELEDTTVYEQMREIIDREYSGKLAIRAEILFHLRTPQDKIELWLTYNEFRKIANDGSHGGGVSWIRGGGNGTEGGALDMIASKLYEKDSEYSYRNGRVNCSCNFLGSNTSWSYAKYDGKWYLHYSGYNGENLRPNSENTAAANRKLPNICTMEVYHGGTKYYGAGLRDKDGTTIGSNIRINNSYLAYNTMWARNCPGSDIVSNTGMKSSNYTTPMIFEGWDYIVTKTVVPEVKGNIRVNEFLLKTNGNYELITTNTYNKLKINTNHSYTSTYSGANTQFLGYVVVNGLVSTVSSTNYTNSKTATVQVNSSQLNKTINFVYKEVIPKGTIRVNEFLLKNGTYTKITSQDYTVDLNVDKSYSTTYSKKATEEYLGYVIENGLKTTPSSTSYSSGTTASTKLTTSKKEVTISFVYEDLSGTIRVRELRLKNGAYEQISSTDNTVKIGDNKTYSTTYTKATTEKYLGYVIENGLVSEPTSSSYTSGTSATTSVSKTQKTKTIIFVYSDIAGTIKVNEFLLTRNGTYEQVSTNTYSNLDITKTQSYTTTYQNKNAEYEGYVIEDGIKSTVSSTRYIISKTANVTLTENARQKTVNFVYKELTGTVKVREILLKSNAGRYDSISENTYKNLQLDKKVKYETTYSDSKAEFIGYTIENSLISTIVYDSNFNQYTDVESVTVTPTVNNREILITFVYKDDFRPLGIGIQFTHYDKTDDRSITPGDEVTRYFSDVSQLIEALYSKENDLVRTDVIETYNNIANSSSNVSDKLQKALAIAANKWESDGTKATRSLNTTNGNFSKYVLVDVDITSTNTATNTSVGMTQIGNTVQYVPNIINMQAAAPDLTLKKNVGEMVTVRFIYESEHTVTIQPINKETGAEIPASEVPTSFVREAKVLHGGCYQRKPDDNISGYTYVEYETPTTDSDSFDGTTIVMPNIIKDEVLKLYYYPSHNVVVRYVDTDTGEEILSSTVLGSIVYGGETETIANKNLEIPDGTGNTKYYVYNNEYTSEPIASEGKNVVSVNTSTENIEVKVDNVTKDIEIKLKYKRLWPITIQYIEVKLDGTEVPIDSKPTETVMARNLEPFSKEAPEITGFDFLNSTPDNVDGVVTIPSVEGPITIIFRYKRLPQIEGGIEPVDPNTVQTDPPSESDEKVIVLDELFKLDIKIIDYYAAEPNSTINVTFPFDVYYEKDGVAKFEPAGVEMTLATIPDPVGEDLVANYEYIFRLPSWVIEKSYADQVQMNIKTYDGNLVAEKITSIKVIGRLYDFTVTNLDGDTEWNQFLFKGGNLNKEYKASTLPIGQAKVGTTQIQNTAYPYGIKLGSTFLFSINTKGLKSDSIQIVPKLAYVDLNGNIISDAKFYYQVAGQGEKEFYLAGNVNPNNFSTALNKPIRSTLELRTEIQKGLELLGKSEYLHVAGDNGKREYANVKNAYKSFNATQIRNFGNYAKLTLPNTLRTPFVNYITQEVPTIGAGPGESHEYGAPDVYRYGTGSITKMEENAIINSVGHWYAEYKLPDSLYVKDNTGKRLETGYIVVLFKISSLDSSGNEYLSYTKPATNTQWQKENTSLGANNTITLNLPKVIGQATNKTVTFNLKSTEYKDYYPVAIYQAGVRLSNDYEVGGTH